MNIVELILNLEKLNVNGLAERKEGRNGCPYYAIPYLNQIVKVSIGRESVMDNNHFVISPYLINGSYSTSIEVSYLKGLIYEILETL